MRPPGWRSCSWSSSWASSCRRAPWSVTVGYIDPAELEAMVEQTSAEAEAAHLSTARVWAPYVLLTVLLLVTRVVDEVKATLNSWTLSWENILGTDISAGFEPLYSPGVIFLIVAAFTAWLHHLTVPAGARGGAQHPDGGHRLSPGPDGCRPDRPGLPQLRGQLDGPAVDAPGAGRRGGGEHRCGLAAGGPVGRRPGLVRLGERHLQPPHVRRPAGVRGRHRGRRAPRWSWPSRSAGPTPGTWCA